MSVILYSPGPYRGAYYLEGPKPVLSEEVRMQLGGTSQSQYPYSTQLITFYRPNDGEVFKKELSKYVNFADDTYPLTLNLLEDNTVSVTGHVYKTPESDEIGYDYISFHEEPLPEYILTIDQAADFLSRLKEKGYAYQGNFENYIKDRLPFIKAAKNEITLSISEDDPNEYKLEFPKFYPYLGYETEIEALVNFKSEVNEERFYYLFSKDKLDEITDYLDAAKIQYYDETQPLDLDEFDTKTVLVQGNLDVSGIREILFSFDPKYEDQSDLYDSSGYSLSNVDAITFMDKLEEKGIKFEVSHRLKMWIEKVSLDGKVTDRLEPFYYYPKRTGGSSKITWAVELSLGEKSLVLTSPSTKITQKALSELGKFASKNSIYEGKLYMEFDLNEKEEVVRILEENNVPYYDNTGPLTFSTASRKYVKISGHLDYSKIRYFLIDLKPIYIERTWDGGPSYYLLPNRTAEWLIHRIEGEGEVSYRQSKGFSFREEKLDPWVRDEIEREAKKEAERVAAAEKLAAERAAAAEKLAAGKAEAERRLAQMIADMEAEREAKRVERAEREAKRVERAETRTGRVSSPKRRSGRTTSSPEREPVLGGTVTRHTERTVSPGRTVSRGNPIRRAREFVWND